MELTLAKRILHLLRKGTSKQKLKMDIHLLLKRSEIGSKILRLLMTSSRRRYKVHHHNHSHSPTATGEYHSSWSGEPNTSILSSICTSTTHNNLGYDTDHESIAKAFEILNSDISDTDSVVMSSPVPFWRHGKKSRLVALKVVSSPISVRDDEISSDGDGGIDKEAEEFIRRFYEQLRLQQLVATTPEHRYCREQPARD